MGKPLDPMIQACIVRLLFCDWTPQAVAKDQYVSVRTVQRIEANLMRYGTPLAPPLLARGRPPSITVAASDQLLQTLTNEPWLFLDEMAIFLEEEFGIKCTTMTVSNLLRRKKWSKKKAQREARGQSDELRLRWKVKMSYLDGDKLVFVDESLFNMDTGRRKRAWAPIGDPARWHDDISRGKSWSILPAYSSAGYLPCTAVKKGYFNAEEFLEWLNTSLLPLCTEGTVIIMDNNSTHVNPGVQLAIAAAGCELEYLPPYSPDFNPIELSFAVLKAWMKRYWRRLFPTHEGDFGSFLRFAIEESRCDRFARKHFQFSGDGYLFQGDIEALNIGLIDEHRDLDELGSINWATSTIDEDEVISLSASSSASSLHDEASSSHGG